MLAQVSNDDGKQRVCSSMPAEADRQREQLRGVLRGLGATPVTPVTILSDGAGGCRAALNVEILDRCFSRLLHLNLKQKL